MKPFAEAPRASVRVLPMCSTPRAETGSAVLNENVRETLSASCPSACRQRKTFGFYLAVAAGCLMGEPPAVALY